MSDEVQRNDSMYPADNAFAITPHDDNDLTVTTRGLYVGTGGDASMILAGDDDPVTFVGLVGGVTHPFRVKRVRATGTTATDLIGVA